MKKDSKELLQDAIGLLRDDLISDAQINRRKTAPKGFLWKALIAASLAAILITGVVIGTIMNRNTEPTYSQPTHSLPEEDFKSIENVWEREDFKSVAFLFENNPLSAMSSAGGQFLMLSNRNGALLPTNTQSDDGQSIKAENLDIKQDASVGLENLIAQRYAVAYDEHFCPVFYDLEQNTVVDLDSQIIGDRKVSLSPFLEACFANAEQLYPGMLSTETNRNLLTEFICSRARDFVEWRLKYDTFQPNIDFLSEIDGFRYDSEEVLRERFLNECLDTVYINTFKEHFEFYHLKPYWVEIMGMDGKNGTCLAIVHDIFGNGLDYVLYDFKTDSYVELPKDRQNALIGTMWGYGDSQFRFSADGKVITVVYPDAGLSGGNIKKSYLDRYKLKADRDLYWYNGEQVGVFYLEQGTAVQLPIRASSEAFLSDSGNVVYYKQCDRVLTEQIPTDKETPIESIKCPDELWYSRLYSANKDTDHWVFAVINPTIGYTVSQTVLQGKFIRFMANETVALMEKGGVYTAYELETGKDVTQEILSSTEYPYYERLTVYEEKGVLYHKDIFGIFEPVALAHADQYILSENGAYAFAYDSKTSKAFCINVASGQSKEVKLSNEFLLQLTEIKDAKLVISYNERENTLLFSLSTHEKNENLRSEQAEIFTDTMLDP